jgi:hypothetical protein
MEPLKDYLLKLYKKPGKVNPAIYETKERLMKLIKEKQIEEMRELLGGNEGIHLHKKK